MPSKTTIRKAKKDLREGKRPSTAAGEFVKEEMEHIRRGKHGARSPQQAIAIGLSKARRAGVPLKPPPKGRVKERTRRSAERAYEEGQGRRQPRSTSRKRSKAVSRALKREGRSAASKPALRRQAKRGTERRHAYERAHGKSSRPSGRKAASSRGGGGRAGAQKRSASNPSSTRASHGTSTRTRRTGGTPSRTRAGAGAKTRAGEATRGGTRRRTKWTMDHEFIRGWAEERGGKPAAVKGTGGGGEDPGMIRLDFPGYSGAESLRPIGWDEWFRKFDESNLALLYQLETSGGEKSNFNKLVKRETAAGSGGEEVPAH